jgi:hypothetical protein
MLLPQHLWSIVVARERKQGSTGVQDGAGGVHGTARWFAGRPAAAGGRYGPAARQGWESSSAGTSAPADGISVVQR